MEQENLQKFGVMQINEDFILYEIITRKPACFFMKAPDKYKENRLLSPKKGKLGKSLKDELEI